MAAVYVSLTYFGTRPSDRAQMWLACAERYSHLKQKIDPPHPGGGFRGLYIVKNLSRRIASKFGKHVRIDTLTLKQIKMLTHPTPGGFRVLYIVNKSFETDRAQIWHACADRYSHLKKYIQQIDTPHPRGV